MIEGILFALFALGLPIFILLLFGRRDADQLWFVRFVVIAGIAHLIALAWINDLYPYTNGGDDQGYYLDSVGRFRSSSEWFDMSRFSNYEQKGYPLFLTWINQLVGESLYLRKVSNVALYLATSIVWYQVGLWIGGPRLAKVAGIAILIATPMWFYNWFLLKDMLILFLQSLIVLGLVAYSLKKPKANFLFVLIGSVLLMPVRFPLFFLNAGVILCVVGYSTVLNKKSTLVNWIAGFGLIAFVILFVALGRDGVFLETMGVSESRRLDETTYQDYMTRHSAVNKYSMLKFPVLFLLGEVQGLNPEHWGEFDDYFLRGLTVAPWILIGVPCVLLGTLFVAIALKHKFFGYRHVDANQRNGGTEPLESDFVDGMVPIIGVTLAFFILCWVVGDTTRYRLTCFPALVFLAAVGWSFTETRRRKVVLVGWVFFTVAISTLYYSLR